MLKKLIGVSLSAVLAASMVSGAVFANAIGTDGQSEEPIAPAAETQDEMSAYLFVHFVGEGAADQEQIYFSLSKDGTNWATLNDKKPVLTSTVGEQGVRDPHIIRKPDGSGFYLIATDLSMYNRKQDWGGAQQHGSHNIVVWESENLVDWSEPHLSDIARENAGCTWAPESVWDTERQQYMVFWASLTAEDWNHRIYRSYTDDFETYTAPEVYIEAEGSRIDTTFYYDEESGVYYRFTKNEEEGKKWVYMEKSTSLSGDFTMVSTFRIDGNPYTNEGAAYEGPTIYKLNGENKWCLLLDSWAYRPFVTDDISKGEFNLAGDFNFGGTTFRHGTVIPIKQREFDALMEKWGQNVEFPKPEEPDPTTGELIYALDFEDNLTPATGSQQATARGSLTYEEGWGGGKAVKFDKDTKSYIELDGSMLAGLDSFTVSFAAKIPNKATGNDGAKNVDWLFLAEKDRNGAAWQNEKYLGILWQLQDNAIISQRFNINNGGRPAVPTDTSHNTANDQWAYITVAYAGKETRLYINGELKQTVPSDVRISTLLGDAPMIFLGYATWGSGEYSYATMDCFKIYNYPLSTEQVAELYNTEKPE